MPDFFGYERHHRMQKNQDFFQNDGRNGPCQSARLRILAVEIRLDDFQVPVAVLVPQELIKDLSVLIEIIIVQRLDGFGGNSLKAAQNPAVGKPGRLFPGPRTGPLKSSRFIRRSRAAFHILFTKCL